MKCGCNSLNCEHSLVNLRRKSQGGYKAMTHLHLHTFHSILDGCGSVDNYIKRAKEFNHPAIAITDHGTVSGTFEMYQKCKEAGIKPIIGMEAYLNDNMDTGDDRDYERKNNHQLILVKDQEGYVNLNKLVYRSYNEGFYYKGRIKTDWLLEHKKGLIITTSCMASKISRLVMEGKENQAEEYVKLLLREFGDDLYAELQLNEVPEQKVYNAFIIKMSSKYNIPPIMTGDVHYASPDDNLLQDTMIAINQHKPLGEAFKLSARHLYYTSDRDFFEFNDKFGFNYDSKFVDLCLENTLRVADKCNFEFEVGKEKFPVYEPTPDVSSYFKTQDTREIITKLAHAKLKQKLKKYNESGLIQIDEEKFKKYTDRLNYELKVISDKKMLDYFLVYWEIIRDYREKGHDVGPARGCFLPETPVLMDTGLVKNIKDIKIGECVLDSQASSQRVNDILIYDIDEEVVELSFSDGTIISCTKDHKFLDNDLEWIEADKIQLNTQNLKSYSTSKHYYDILITSYKRDVFLTSKRYFNYKGPVYDLTVNGTSSYNVNGIIVHNSAAGSLLSWCLDITKIDPVRFELYFERFLNPERNCLTKNCYVILKDGSYKNIVDVKIGDPVVTENGMGTLIQKYERELREEESVFEIETESGLKVQLTGCHIIPVVRNGKRIDIRVDELLYNDQLFIK